MEATKEKKKKKSRSGPGEAHSEAATSVNMSEVVTNQNLMVESAQDVTMHIDNEPVDSTINTAELHSSSDNADISLQHVGQVTEVNGNSQTIQETALIEVVSTVPTAPFFEGLDVGGSSTQVIPECIQSTISVTPLTSMKYRHGYEALTETSLIKLYLGEDLTLSDEPVNVCCNKLVEDLQHPFCITVQHFLRIHRMMQINATMLENKKTQLNVQIEKVWDAEKKTIMETGECQDGNPVSTELVYSIHHFNEVHYLAFAQSLNDLKDHCHGEIICTTHSAELLRQRLSHYIDALCNQCLENIMVDQPVQLLSNAEQSEIKDHVMELRTCIEMLFKFSRRKTCSHDSYSHLLKVLLIKLVEVLLKVGTNKDHLFLLQQVLSVQGRIPDWMKQFIQIPIQKPEVSLLPVLQRHHLAHIMAVLAKLMRPVKNHLANSDGVIDFDNGFDERNDEQDTSWVLVDSDGDDNSSSTQQISVNDIIDLFNQLPLEAMYASVLLIVKVESNRYNLDITHYDDRYMIEVIAFCTMLVKEFRVGLQTYGTIYYMQFAKRLGQLIKHTAQYVTDVYERYSGAKSVGTNSSNWPLQCEYDMFIVRCVNAIYSSQNLGTWQFLATMPFHMISTSTLWQIYGLLHKEYNESLDVHLPSNGNEWELFIAQTPILSQFEDRLCVLRESESMYLLASFSYMAFPSQKMDISIIGFMRTVTLNLFQIGFMSEITQDRFTKHVRALLATISAQFPALISDILKEMQYFNFMDTENSCLDLFRDLPLLHWVPKNEDLIIIRRWLTDKPLLSTEFSLARLILANLNYNVNEAEPCWEDLVLNHRIHCTIGLMVVEAALRSAPEQSCTASSSTAVFCDMVYKYVAPTTGLEVIMKWAWKILSQLRIHSMDRGKTIPRDTIASPEVFLTGIPDLYGHEHLQAVATGVLRIQPIAMYLAVQLTTWGHNIPLICSKGFPLVDLLIRNQCYTEALKCIYLLVPMFLKCPESLIQCDIFRTIIVNLYGADKSFIKLGKPFSSPDFPGKTLGHLGSLISVHLIQAGKGSYGPGPDTFESMISLWLHCLLKIPDWVNDPSTLFLMDQVLREAFTCNTSYVTARHMLYEMYMPPLLDLDKEEMKMPGQTNPLDSNSALNTPENTTVAMFLKFKNKAVHPPVQSLMSKVSLPNTPWFALFALMIEKFWQDHSQLWPVILIELYYHSTRASVDIAIQRVVVALKLPISVPVGSLAIYRLANQALDTPIGHRILPYLWQLFFSLYLERVPAEPIGSRGGVGHRFFEGTVGQNLIKRIKKQLLDTAAYYSAQEAKLRDETKGETGLEKSSQKEINQFQKTAKLFKTFHLWLEDQRLMESYISLPNLEPMYDIPKLKAIFNNNEDIWIEYLSNSQHRATNLKHSVDWNKLLYRYCEPKSVSGTGEKKIVYPMDKTCKMLSSYETPVTLEEAVFDIQPIIPEISAEVMMYKENLLVFVNEQFDVLSNVAQLYMQNLAEHTALDCAVLELLPSLYSNIGREKILTAECHSSPPHRGTEYHARQSTCAGPAEIRVMVTESQLSEAVNNSISENRNEWLDVIKRTSRPPHYETYSTMTTLDMLAAKIVNEYNEACTNGNEQRKIVLKELAVTYFFHLIENYTESLKFFPPTESMMRSLLMLLAEPFLKNGFYVEQLLLALLEKPCLVPILSAYLVPVEAKTSTFLQLYGVVAKKAYDTQPDENTFAALLSKFSVDDWLKKHRTTFAERCTLIDEISIALEAAGLQPDPRNERVYQIIRDHFVTILRFEFPGHFGKILSHLLRGSAQQRISVEVWYDFINALFGEKKLCLGDDMAKVKEDVRLFATEQKSLSYIELRQTIYVLGRYFLMERNMYGLYGLYPKYRTYVEPIMILQAMIDHSLIVATLSKEEGALSSTICERVWPALDEIYSPWIAPLQTEHMVEPPAAWIDQLAEDRSVLLPWIPPDLLLANKAVMMFIESIRFILDTVSGEILSYLWQYYVAKFVHKAITEGILSVIQNHMELLPWQQFRPCLLDMDLLFKVITQSVPTQVYAFLGTIFVKVAWVPWLNNMMHMHRDNYEVQTKLHVYMLHLHVKLSKDNDVRKSSKVTEMLMCAKKFDWHFVDASAYGQVIDWWVFKYDPKVAAGLGEPYVNPIDICVMNLLEVAGGFSTEVQLLNPTSTQKRIVFIRGKIKMLIKCSNVERTFVERNVNDVSLSFLALLSSIENIVQRTVKEECRLEECSLLIKEVVVIFNQPETSELRKVALRVCSSWLMKENSMSVVVQGFLRVVGTDVTNSATMGQLLEICLNSFFKHTVVQVSPPSWSTAAQLMSAPMVPNIEDALLSGGYFLTLHALLYQQVSSTKSIREEVTLLSNLVDWICQLKAASIEEVKLPLLWGVALLLIHRQCKFSESLLSITRSIRRLITHFLEISEEKGQFWNLLGTLGIRKHVNLSPKGRFLCRAMAVFLLAQLPEGGGEQFTIRMEANAPGAITNSQESIQEVVGPTPSGDAVRALCELEALTSCKSFGELKDTIDLALKLIKDPAQSIMTARQFLGTITAELFTEQYLHVLTM